MLNKALFLIDLQNGFILDRNKYIIDNIKTYIKNNITGYTLIAYSRQFNVKNSVWERQHEWKDMMDKNSTDCQINLEIQKLLTQITKENPNIYIIELEKLAASIFKGNILSSKLNGTELINKLDKDSLSLDEMCKYLEIKEIDICGLETNVCVLSSVLESFDLGYLSYVIESCSETGTTESNHIKTIDILKYNNMVK